MTRRRGVVAATAALAVAATPAAAWAVGTGATADRSPEDVRAAARRVLGRAEFHKSDQSNRIADALQWIFEHLFPRFLTSGVSGGAGLFGALVWIAIIGGLAFLVTRLVRTWRPRPKAVEPVAATTVVLDERRTAKAWGELADQLTAEGRYREAVRARYGELVASLVDDGSVAALPGRTSGEYVTDVALTRPTALDAFTAATLAFEAAWYGGRESSVDELEQLRSLAAEVRSAPRVPADPADAAEVVP